MSEIFYEKKLYYLIYQYNNDYEDEKMAYERRRGFTNRNPNRRDGFPNH